MARDIPHEHRCSECNFIWGCDNPACSQPYLELCTEMHKNYRTGEKFSEHQRPVRAIAATEQQLEKRIAEIEKRYYSAMVVDNKLQALEARIEAIEKALQTTVV